MDWFEVVRIQDIPKPGFDLRLKYMDEYRAVSPLNLIHSCADTLNVLTQNDPAKEQAMGALLINATFIEGLR